MIREPDSYPAVPAGFPEEFGGRCRDAFQFFPLRFPDLLQVGYKAAQGIEFVLVEQLGNPRFLRAADPELRLLDLECYVGFDGNQRLAQSEVGHRFPESGLLPGREFVQMVEDGFERAVFRHQFSGADFADAGNTLHVVGRIAPDGQDVDNLAGIGNAVLAADILFREYLLVGAGLAGLVLEDVVVHDLTKVLVRCDHIDVESLSGKFPGYCSDDVIRFEAGFHQHRNVERIHDFRQGLEGSLDQFRCGGPRGLVFRVEFVPERSSRRVEHDGQVRGLFPRDQFQQVFGKPEKDGGICTFRIDHGPAQESVVHPEDQGMSVDQVECIHNLQIYYFFPSVCNEKKSVKKMIKIRRFTIDLLYLHSD